LRTPHTTQVAQGQTIQTTLIRPFVLKKQRDKNSGGCRTCKKGGRENGLQVDIKTHSFKETESLARH
jgi:hypothetical protein